MPVFSVGEEQEFVKHCKRAWKAWCDKFGYEFIIMDTPVYDLTEIPPTFQRFWILDILKDNGIEFDQVAQVDYDTYPTDVCGDFFQLTDNKFAAVLDTGWLPALNRITRTFAQYYFPDTVVTVDDYFNAGMIVYNASHKPHFEKIREFYIKEYHKYRTNTKPEGMTDSAFATFQEMLSGVNMTGDDQTLLNIVLRQDKCDVKLLPRSYNMISPENERFFWEGPDHRQRTYNVPLSIRQCVNIFHFTGDTPRRNAITRLLDSFMWKQDVPYNEYEPTINARLHNEL